VTHDQEEAFSMSDREVVMNQGRVVQVGAPVEIYEKPANHFAARFVGEANEFDGVVGEREGERIEVRMEGRVCLLETGRDFAPGQRVKVLLRPEDLLVERAVPEGDPKPWWPGVISETVYKGSTWDMAILLENGTEVWVTEFFDEDAEEMTFRAGERVFVSWFDGWEMVLPEEEADEEADDEDEDL
ncbi:MAG: TOBE domain-containing protein, partial [Desulfovibrionaceae bacterium]